MQTHVPGYRDRIVAVLHTGEEGGLNLDMQESVVQQLAVRGQAAGRRTEEFDMVNHRWVRFRSFLEVLEDLVVPAASSLASTDPPDDVPTYRAMIDGEPPSAYRNLWNAEAGHDLADAIQQLADAYEAARMDDGRSRFEEGAPSPTPELQIRPRP